MKVFIDFRSPVLRCQGEQVRSTSAQERSAPSTGNMSRSEHPYESTRLLGDVQTEPRNEYRRRDNECAHDVTNNERNHWSTEIKIELHWMEGLEELEIKQQS